MQRITIRQTSANGRRVHEMLADGMYKAKISCNAITKETASFASPEVIAECRFQRTRDDGGLRKRRKRKYTMGMRLRVKCSLGQMIYVIYYLLCVPLLLCREARISHSHGRRNSETQT